MQQRSKLGLIISLALTAAAIWAVFNWQSIRDWFVLSSYQPSSEIAAIAKRTTMTDKAKQIFYASDPELNSREEFGLNCPKPEKGINVLGCYQGGLFAPGRIYLFRIEDQQLVDEIDVTAAHELLHAAYQRLSYFEREKLNDRLAEAAADLPASQLTDVIKAYIRENNYNELHSHLGTEYSSLPADLEDYYGRYFKDRQAIVEVHVGNEALFKVCENQEQSQRSSLEFTKSRIESTKSQLESLRARMDQLLAEGRREEYNALVPQHNQLVAQHNSSVATYNSQVRGYNSLVSRCNSLSGSLNSEISPIDTIRSR